jgi:hypothetical protein
MRTHSGKTNTPGTSRGRATTDPPPAPTINDTLAALMNVSNNNECMLQTLVQGRPSLEAFLKTQPPIFY